jgi:hypothetical protein
MASVAVLRKTLSLADTYAEDGAHHTALVMAAEGFEQSGYEGLAKSLRIGAGFIARRQEKLIEQLGGPDV